MAIQFKRGTSTANDGFTGPNGSVSVDFTSEAIRVHDGVTAGGVFSVGGGGDSSTDLSVNYTTGTFTVTSSTGTNATVDAANDTTAGAMSSTDKAKLDGVEEGAESNEAFASTAEAEAGASTTVVMSPARTVELIEAGNYTIDEGTL